MEVKNCEKALLVIYIKNVMKKNLINKFAPFHAYEGTEDVDFAKELHIVSDNIFIKYKGNAFTNSGLDILLKKTILNMLKLWV